jgi:6-methylsalicylate decarboxylase
VHFGDDAAFPGAEERGRFADTARWLYWDTASAFVDPVLHLLRSVVGLGNVVFGTDYPYPHDDISIGGLRSVEHTAELSDEERRAVLGETASRLIPRLARQLA